jgi:hypothetical protein
MWGELGGLYWQFEYALLIGVFILPFICANLARAYLVALGAIEGKQKFLFCFWYDEAFWYKPVVEFIDPRAGLLDHPRALYERAAEYHLNAELLAFVEGHILLKPRTSALIPEINIRARQWMEKHTIWNEVTKTSQIARLLAVCMDVGPWELVLMSKWRSMEGDPRRGDVANVAQFNAALSSSIPKSPA